MKNKTIIISVIFCVILAAILIGASAILSRKTIITDKNNSNEVKEFRIDAFRFSYNPNNIKVKKGDKVKIIINNTDTTHGIRIPELDIADNNVLEFIAEKSGQFTWFCNNFCGDGHPQMQGTLIVE